MVEEDLCDNYGLDSVWCGCTPPEIIKNNPVPKRMKNKIHTWQNLTNEITENWIRDYFEIEDDETFDFDWVGDDVGSIFNFADYWFNFSDVLDCYKHEISKEHLFTWYGYCLENQKINISLAKFILLPEEKIKREKEYLEQLRERVEYAKKEFDKALEEFEKGNKIT